MALSQDLINQFVKLTDKEEKPKEVTVNGTYRMINGEEYVQIDGSEIWTPVTSTVEAETGERVKVMIKNHTATVTGNISSPSARSKSVKDLKDEVDEQGNTIKQLDNTIEQQGNSIIQIDNNIKQVNNDILQANNAINQQGNIIKQLGNEINQQGDVINSMNNDIEANSNEITAINNTIVQQNNTITQHGNTIEQQGNIIRQQGNEINQHGNKIDQLDNDINQQGNAITQINNKIVQQDNVIQQQGNIIDQQDNIITEHGNNITILNSGFSIIDGVLVGLSQAIIDELKTKHLDAEYATIDFANINMAAVTKLFTESGIIKDLVVQEGKITGELVGVTIKGDLIEGNTIAAEKLVVKGSDGLYYKLNIDGLNNISTDQASKFVLLDTKPEDWETNYKDYYIIQNNEYIHLTGDEAPTWTSNTYYKLSSTYESGLDGTNIVAKSITADKVSVTDLVAFGATIGGFNISQHSIYSGGKNSVNNVSRGVYMDDDGQIAFGDNNNFIKFFKDNDNQYKIMIKANEIYTSSNSKTIAEQMSELAENMNDAIKSVTNLYYASDSPIPPSKPTAHVGTDSTSGYSQWNIALPTYNEQYPYLYTCKETSNKGGTYDWTTVEQTTYAEAVKTIQTELNAVQADYLKETTFSDFKRDQIEKDNNIIQSLKQTSVTIYGNDDGTIDPDAGEALVNRLNKVDNDLNGEDGALDRIEAAEGTLENTGLNEYDQAIKITQRFLNIETDVEQIKNIFKITGGTNLIQNSVGYFADKTGKPTMWDITANTIYTPFGYDGDLVGVTISRGKLFCAKGSMNTTQNNIMALLANKKMSISFKYKNGANATSKVKIFNGSVTFFEKTFSSTVNSWTEVTATFDCTVNSLQITIESTNATNNNGILISDLMLNYGDVKPWELCSNEVYGAMVKLSSLGIEVTATTAHTKNFMTTDGILVYEYDSQHDIVGNLITKITDDGILTNQLESTGDIIERNLVHTMINDSENHDVYVEYIL